MGKPRPLAAVLLFNKCWRSQVIQSLGDYKIHVGSSIILHRAWRQVNDIPSQLVAEGACADASWLDCDPRLLSQVD